MLVLSGVDWEMSLKPQPCFRRNCAGTRRHRSRHRDDSSLRDAVRKLMSIDRSKDALEMEMLEPRGRGLGC